MSAKDTMRCNKTTIQEIFCGDPTLILNKTHEKNLITLREYNNLKSINKETVEGHMVELVDKIMNKGEETCQNFLNLLQTDDDIKSTYPELKKIQLNHNCPLSRHVQACSDDRSPEETAKKDEQYQLNSRPVGLCLIINNENFSGDEVRRGSSKDAQSLSEVFSWLDFTVLMCEDQTKDQMDQTLKCFASLSDVSQLQRFSVKEWCYSRFTDLQQPPPKHGDAFICCILSHGREGVVIGIDGEPLCIKQITRTFKATDHSALTDKPKVFLIQACQGPDIQHRVLLKDVEADDFSSVSIPEESDVLVAAATVEDYKAFRHIKDGSWFVQSVCQQLKEGCPRNESSTTTCTETSHLEYNQEEILCITRFTMSAKDTIRRNKTTIQEIFCGDPTLILNKTHEKNLITLREYNNLKSINKETVEGHVVELVDKIMNKGEETCQNFLNLLQTDDDIKSTYPELKKIQLNHNCPLSRPVQACSDDCSPEHKRPKKDEQYQLNSRPVGLCLIINNENFRDGNMRRGSSKDAQSLSEVFSWLGFRVLMCEDQTKDQMDQTLKCFASLSDVSQLQGFSVKEWCYSRFTDLQQPPPKHGDAFICCILSHGKKGVVFGIDGEPLCIKQITRTFKATDHSALTGKPKVFLIQACQGPDIQCGVLLKDLEADDSSIPEEADVLVAAATVEDYKAFRHTIDGSWFVQSVCQQLKEGCPRGDDIFTILCRVNNEVSQKEGSSLQPGAAKQMSEISRVTLRKKLVLIPYNK